MYGLAINYESLSAVIYIRSRVLDAVMLQSASDSLESASVAESTMLLTLDDYLVTHFWSMSLTCLSISIVG